MSDADPMKEREIAAVKGGPRPHREIKEREPQGRSKELVASRWATPFAAAVVTGVIGIVGAYFAALENLQIERKKQEGNLILEMIKTGGTGADRERQAAANLVFLADAGLATIGKEQLQKLRQTAGNASPGLPTAGNPTSTFIPDDIRQRILKRYDQFAMYFTSLGIATPPKVNVDFFAPASPLSTGGGLYYDRAKSTVYIAPGIENVELLTLREYAHAVLYAGDAWPTIDRERDWAYVAVESGLASYFPSSFVDDPGALRTQSPDVPEDDEDLGNFVAGSTARFDGLLRWGKAFWALRGAAGQDAADRILLKAWHSLTPADVQKNDPKDFVRAVLRADTDLFASQHAAKITDVFKGRGLSL